MSGSALFLQWEAWNLISNYILLILFKELFSQIKNFLIMLSFPLDFMTISMFVQNRILAHNVNLKSREGNSFIRFYSILRICKWIYSVGNAEPHRTALLPGLVRKVIRGSRQEWKNEKWEVLIFKVKYKDYLR